MKDVMLDFETLGNSKNAAVVQIGACYFDRHTGTVGKTFSVGVTPESAVKSGANMDASTVLWWLDQSKEAQDAVFKGPAIDINTAFYDLNQFLSGAKAIWSHATFDFVILQETMKRLSITPTYRYAAARDIRTLQDLANVGKEALIGLHREGVHHNAIDDCIFQVKYCVLSLNKLKGVK